MKLQLYLNGSLYNEMQIEDYLFRRLDENELTEEERTEWRKKVVEENVQYMKGIFISKISKAKRWQIFLVAESRPDEYYEKEPEIFIDAAGLIYQ